MSFVDDHYLHAEYAERVRLYGSFIRFVDSLSLKAYE